MKFFAQSFVMILVILNITGASALKGQDLQKYQLNNEYKFEGYPKSMGLGATGIYLRNGRLYLVQVQYHPNRLGIAIQYKVPGWVLADKFLEQESNKVYLEYIYLELLNRLNLPVERGPIITKLKKIMLTSEVRSLLQHYRTSVLWAYTHVIDFRLRDGGIGTFPLGSFVGTIHEEPVLAAYNAELAKKIATQIAIFDREVNIGGKIQANLIRELPVGPFGPTWMTQIPGSQRTVALMKQQQNAKLVFQQAGIRQRYIGLLRNAL
ncbi:hypothetical protein OAI33_13870 [Pirellulaceae bacterium]|nr:hypothetical protein [Pirellulaceae bacterium]